MTLTKKILLSLLMLVIVTCGVGVYLWKSGWIERWIERRAVEYYVSKIAPHLPVEILEVDLESSWKDLRKGKLSSLKIRFKYDSIVGQLKGPIEVSQVEEEKYYSIKYKPLLKEESGAFSDLSLEIWAKIDDSLENLRETGVFANANAFSVEGHTLETEKLFAGLTWTPQNEGDNTTLYATTKNFTWVNDTEDRAIDLVDPGLTITARVDQDQMAAPEAATIYLQGEKAEVLWGEEIYSLPWKALPLKVSLNAKPDRVLSEGTVAIDLGQKKNLQLRANATYDEKYAKLDWNLSAPVKASLDIVGNALGAPPLSGWEISGGKASSKGNLRAERKGTALGKIVDLDTELRVQSLTLFQESIGAGFKNLNLVFPLSFSSAEQGYFEAERVDLRKLSSPIPRSEFSVLSSNERVEILFRESIKWDPAGTKIQVRSPRIQISRGAEGGKAGFQVDTSLSIPDFRVNTVLDRICENDPRLPRVRSKLDWPRLQITQDKIDTDGEAFLDFFGGKVSLTGFSVRDYLKEVPETRANVDWSGIELDSMGTWSKFGKMDGTLEGYAKGIVLQSTLPTHYDFRVEIKPRKRKRIVFTPKAMKNFVKLFTGDDLDQLLPGIASWLAFGWPSEFIGGYDVDYVGLSALSTDGSILVTTHDPPEIVEKEQNRFILYGTRFKIPVKSSRYPVVLDAPGVANLVHHVMGRFRALEKGSESSLNSDSFHADGDEKQTKKQECFDVQAFR